MSQLYSNKDNLIYLKKQPFLAKMVCPITETQVSADNWKYPFRPSGRIIWWHCPACQGWHVSRRLIEQLSEHTAKISTTDVC